MAIIVVIYMYKVRLMELFILLMVVIMSRVEEALMFDK